MRDHRVLLCCIILLATNILYALSPFVETIQANTPPTLYVGAGEQYTKIQDAINNATDGYRIFVYNGTYTGSIIINKKIDLFGEGRNITTINGNNAQTVIKIIANNVNISHFTIKSSSTTRGSSIINIQGNNSIITDNIISNGYHGIYLNKSRGHLIYDNIIQNNARDGIYLNRSNANKNISYNTIKNNYNGIYLYNYSSDNKIYNNIIQNNNLNGIYLDHSCDNNIIRNNNCSKNTKHGIYINDYSNHSTIAGNTMYLNGNSGLVFENSSWSLTVNSNTIRKNSNYGVMIVGSYNILQNNTITHNNRDGVFLTADNNNTILNNLIGYNTVAGIRLHNSTDNLIQGNEIYRNTQYGVDLDFYTLRNRIYNNYFHHNTRNARDKSINKNQWNISKINGTNKAGGPIKCGNYWDDFDETSEGAYDLNNDGLADTAYTIFNDNKDYGPLLDGTAPIISSIQANPSIQIIGSYTNISAVVTDNMAVKGVYLIITNPKNQISNISITQNKTGNTYFCRKQFSPIGEYSYYIAAHDARSWKKSSTDSFSIREGTPPTVVDNSPTKGAPSSIFAVNATVTDDQDNATDLQVFFIWSHGRKSGNNSLVTYRKNYFVMPEKQYIILDNTTTPLTYYFYARDHWGNAVKTTQKTVPVIDTQPPTIHLIQHGKSFDEIPGSYTYSAIITDNVAVANVIIQYWYEGSKTRSVPMDHLGNNYYKKVIIPSGSPERLYCIIAANDTNGNSNTTKNPYSHHGGPYHGFVLQPVVFDGTNSFDLDGAITNYSWIFGDETKGYGATPTHTYYTNGNYTVTLTVTDNEQRTATNTTYVQIYNFTKITTSDITKIFISETFNITLSQNFYAYDSNGDEIVDTFIDPNKILKVTHPGYLNLSGNISFLLSIDDTIIPEFIWNTTTDEILLVNYTIGSINKTIINEEEETALFFISIQKAQWMFIEITDVYPHATITIRANERIISPDLIWRKNGKIFFLDDPETTYQIVCKGIYPPLTEPLFSPGDGGIINEDSPTVYITFSVPVTITYAAFGSTNIKQKLITADNKVFTYTPPGYLEDGTYTLELDAQALQGKGHISSMVTYFYFAYVPPPQQSFFEKYGMYLIIGGFIATIAIILLWFRIKQVTLDDFIYIKNKKIIPFIKTLIIGPVSIQINEPNITKAEFFVDGQLKETLTAPPYFWKWDEKAIMKHTLETKVYDQQGNSASTGEMTFYIFNPAFFK
ncbi:MAG: NosD domain-containing protein [Candidatus Thermoplasmatota archaeon]